MLTFVKKSSTLIIIILKGNFNMNIFITFLNFFIQIINKLKSYFLDMTFLLNLSSKMLKNKMR